MEEHIRSYSCLFTAILEENTVCYFYSDVSYEKCVGLYF